MFTKIDGLHQKWFGVFIFSLSILFIANMFANGKGHDIDIGLVPIGVIDPLVIEDLKNDLSRMLNKKVSLCKGMPEPDYAFNKKRNQYLSTAILMSISEQQEYSNYKKILGIVDHDMYVPELNFVFGEASRSAAVISLTRLRQDFYHLPENRSLFQKRVLTEAVHELGHTYGLGHCTNPQCVMFFSNSLMDTDRKGPEFCTICRRKLH